MKPKFNPSTDTKLTQRLRAAGCPMPSPEAPEAQCDLKVEVTNPQLTIAYDRRVGAEYVFGLRITNSSYRRLTVDGIRVRLPWAAHMNWLGDPMGFSSEPEVYRLDSGRKFRYQDVINHRVWGNCELGPAESLEGLLLAYTMFERIPFDYLHGESAAAKVSVMDQFGRKHRSDIEVLVDRTGTMRPFIPNPNRKSLFAGRELEANAEESKQIAEAEEGKPRVPRVQ